MLPIEEIMKTFGLFWEYPVITEKAFYMQNKQDDQFFGFPWACLWQKISQINAHGPSETSTVLQTQLDSIYQTLYNIRGEQIYYTCCQQVAFRQFIPLWQCLNIRTVYAVHKTMGEDVIGGITIKPCPLYAVNIEDKSKNKIFQDADLLTKERDIIYSFAGAHNHDYISNIRIRIFQMKHPPHTYIRNTGTWHFAGIVFSEKQNIKGELNIDAKYTENTKKYNELLLRSRYTLSPSGAGPNSIRFWEALGAGSIPILLADTLDLPAHELWEKAILRVAEKDLENIPTLLGQISLEEERKRRENCLTLYSHFKNNYRNK